MNYYRRHIGDYLRDTAHLTLLEHGVYTRLMDVYYTREAVIPSDQAARLIGARTDEELAAVSLVLNEFFEQDTNGWRQSRCDREIDTYSEKAERNREVGKLGGRPRKEPTKNPNGFKDEPKKNPDVTHSQEPIANSHKPVEKKEEARALLPDWLPPDAWEGYLEMRKVIKAKPTDRALMLLIRDLAKWHEAGHDIAAILDKSTKANYRGLFPPDGLAPRQQSPPTQGKYSATIAGLTGRTRQPEIIDVTEHFPRRLVSPPV